MRRNNVVGFCCSLFLTITISLSVSLLTLTALGVVTIKIEYHGFGALKFSKHVTHSPDVGDLNREASSSDERMTVLPSKTSAEPSPRVSVAVQGNLANETAARVLEEAEDRREG